MRASFTASDIALLKKIIDDAVAGLGPQERAPLAQMIASHRIPREERRKKHDIHNMQATLNKQYGS